MESRVSSLSFHLALDFLTVADFSSPVLGRHFAAAMMFYTHATVSLSRIS